MAITKLRKHDSHEIKTVRIYNSHHYGELRCRDCDKHIQWLTKEDYKQINRIIYSRQAYRGYDMASVDELL